MSTEPINAPAERDEISEENLEEVAGGGGWNPPPFIPIVPIVPILTPFEPSPTIPIETLTV